MYHIFILFFKHAPIMRLIGEIEELWFGGRGSVSFQTFLHEPNLSMLPSAQRMVVASQAYGRGPVLEISTPKEFLYMPN